MRRDVPEIRVGVGSFEGDEVIGLGKEKRPAESRAEPLEIVEGFVRLTVAVGEVADLAAELVSALARGEVDHSGERVPVLGVQPSEHLLARGHGQKPQIHALGAERVAARDSVHDREHLIAAAAAEMELPSLADDAGLESDRLLVIVHGKRAEILGGDDLLRGAVLLADRDLDIARDVDHTHLHCLFGDLEVDHDGLVRVHLDDFLHRGISHHLGGQGVGADRNFDDREFSFRVGATAEVGAFEDDVGVGHADPAIIRDLPHDRARLCLGGCGHGAEREEAEQERDGRYEHRQKPVTARLARHKWRRSFLLRRCQRKPAIFMPFLRVAVKPIRCETLACPIRRPSFRGN